MLGLGPLGVKYEAPMVSNMSCTFWPMKFQCPGSVEGSVVQVCLCLAVLALFIGLLLWLTTAPVFDFGKGVGPSGGHSETNFDDTQVPLKKGRFLSWPMLIFIGKAHRALKTGKSRSVPGLSVGNVQPTLAREDIGLGGTVR